MSECPRGDSAAALAAPAAAAAAPSVATATALNLARAVLTLSAEEKVPAAARGSPAAAAAAAKAAVLFSGVPARTAGAEPDEEKETPPPAAALFRAEELCTALSSGVETPEASDSPAAKGSETTAATRVQHGTAARGGVETTERSPAAAATAATTAAAEEATLASAAAAPAAPDTGVQTTSQATSKTGEVVSASAVPAAGRVATEAATAKSACSSAGASLSRAERMLSANDPEPADATSSSAREAAGAATVSGTSSAAAAATAAAAGVLAGGRGLKRAPEGGLMVQETGGRNKSEARSGDEEGAALLAKLQHQRSCLIITDVQNDFCEGGALGGPGRRAVISRINQLRRFSVAAGSRQQTQKQESQQQQLQREERKEPETSAARAPPMVTTPAAAGAAAAEVEAPKTTPAAAAGEAATATEQQESAAATTADAEELDSLFSAVVVSQDWHPPDHASFASVHSSSCNPRACSCGDTLPSSSPVSAAAAATSGEAAGGDIPTAAAAAGKTAEGVTTADIDEATKGPTTGTGAASAQQKTKEQQTPSTAIDPQQQETLVPGKRIRRAATNLVLDLWPVHCVQHSFGAALHPALITRPTDFYIKKGTRRGVENYSCFGSELEDTGLTAVLQRERIEVIVIVGFTTEYCVRATALSALNVPGIQAVYVLTDCCCSIDPQQQDAVFRGMQQQGVRLCSLRQLLDSAESSTAR